MSSKQFKKLLQNSKTLVDSTNNNDSSKLQRELGQIAAESFLLKSKINSDQGLNTTAHYFLAQSGTNTKEMTENLTALDTKVTFQPSKRVPNNDVESYLKQVHEDIVITTVEESNSITRAKLLDRLDDNLHNDWMDEKRRILEEWDHEQEDKQFGHMARNKDKKLQAVKDKMISYAKTIQELNHNRLISEKIPLINKLKSVSLLTQCDKAQERSRAESWDVITKIANESKSNGHRVGAAFASDSCNWIASSKSWLENEYQLFINNTLNNKAAEAKVGGRPSLQHRIKAFMELIFMKNLNWINPIIEVENNKPIWLFTYLLLRSGHADLALNFVEQHVNSYYKTPDFPQFLREYLSSPQKTVSAETHRKILDHYQEMVYGNVQYDPYKVLLYKVIGRCELENPNIPSVITTIEDYLWLELSLVRDGVHDKSYRLSDFQKKITAYGPAYFDPNGKNPWYYFKILLISLQFERAIDYLYKSEEFRSEAVHFAIALAYYGLIRVPTNPRSNTADLLVTEFDGGVSLNFARIINQYVRLFVSDHVVFGLQYLYLITLYPSEDMSTICREHIVNYIAGRADYKDIVGSVDYGQGQQGLVSPYQPLIGISMYDHETYCSAILSPIAQKFQEKGKYIDAVNVYQLSNKYSEALQVLNRQLDHALTISARPLNVEGSQKDQQLIDFCTSTLKNYESRAALTRDDEVLAVHRTLLRLLQATLFYKKSEYEQTVQLIKSTQIFPESDDYKELQIATTRFNKNTAYSIRKHMDQILIMFMESYSKLCAQYSKHSVNLYTMNQVNINKLKKEAETVLSFVGLIDYKIPAEIVARLNKQDVLSRLN